MEPQSGIGSGSSGADIRQTRGSTASRMFKGMGKPYGAFLVIQGCPLQGAFLVRVLCLSGVYLVDVVFDIVKQSSNCNNQDTN